MIPASRAPQPENALFVFALTESRVLLFSSALAVHLLDIYVGTIS